MLWETSFSEENDAMPQTVPRSGRSPPAARPSDERAVPHSPPSLRRLLRLLGAASPPADPPAVPHAGLDAHKPQTQQQHDVNFLDQFYNFGYQSPLYPTPSPSSDDSSIPSINVQPCSPFDQAAAYTATDILGTHLNPVKEEPSSSLLSPSYSNSPYPLSPSESCVSYLSDPSPQCYQPISPSQYHQRSVEEEYIDIENLLKENQILQESLGVSINHNNIQQNYLCNSDLLLTPKVEKDDRPKDHQLLREVLEDTSFQKRLNLKPVSFDDLSAEFGNPANTYIKMEEGETSEEAAQPSTAFASEKIDQVLSLAIEQTRKDVENTCTMLGISPDPVQWSSEDVKAWLLFQLRQYSLPLVPVEYFSMDGAKLAALTEEEFTQRAPQAGSTLHAQLEIWKAARHEGWPAPAPPAAAEPPAEPSDDEESESSGPSRAPTGKGGGAHIHLWQFLKELLAAPQLHAAAIRWLDRENGVFKIEDSVRVARLWGKRKNRPAMNYDKLSRSIRQYYKKGIMKKTERSQRLVYQFCHPYSL